MKKEVNYKKLSKGAMLIVFLALIRCLFEPFRLHHLGHIEDFDTIKPFLLAALVSGILVLVMIIAFFYQKYKIVSVLAVICILILIIIKVVYHL